MQMRLSNEAKKKILSINDFIDFTDEIIIKSNKYLNKWRSKFDLDTNITGTIIPDTGMFIYILPLIEEIKSYYNNDLCISAAMCKAAFDNNSSYKVKAYYCEGVIFKLESVWEYLFIILSEYLHTELVVGYDIKEDLINAKCHNIWFNKTVAGVEPEVTPVETSEKIQIIERLQKELKVFKIAQKNKSNTVYKTIKRKYCISDRIQAIFDLYKSPAVNEIVNLRNEIIHRRPLGAKFSMGKLSIAPGQAVCIDNKGWYDINKLPELIEENLKSVRMAIQILYELIFLNDVPNTLKNKDKIFYAYNIKCNKCLKASVIADMHVEEIKKNSSLSLICPWCKSEDISIDEKETVNEQFYFSNVIDYMKILSNHCDSK